MFFKTKICGNKLHIYPEVEVQIANQDPAEFIALGFLVLEHPSYSEYRVYPSRNII